MSYQYKVGGKSVELELDPSVVAVHFKPGPKSFRSGATASAGVGPFSARFEVPGEELTLVPSAVAAAIPTSHTAASAMASLNAQPEVQHALPVFRVAGNQVVTTNRVIIGLDSVEAGQALAQKHGLEILEAEDDRLLAKLPEGADPFAVVAELDAEPGVLFAEPDFVTIGRHIPKRVSPPLPPILNDPLLPRQYAMTLVRAVEAWTHQVGDPAVKIAILDEGVQSQHPDLKSAVIDTYDATAGDSDQEPNTWDGHGTACAGLAAAVGGNGIGVRGVAAGASLLAVRIAYSDQPRGPWVTSNSKIRDGIKWAWQRGADVLSNSWGSGAASNDIANEFEKARTRGRNGLGAVVVIAAGNNSGAVLFPGTLANVLTVSASNEYDEAKTTTSKDGEYWWGTNHGPEVDIAAPGVHNMTTDIGGADGYTPDDYTPDFNGTSSATPIVAGACALVISANRNLTGAEVADIIKRTADKVGPYPYVAGRNDFFGSGRLNVEAAVLAAAAAGSAPSRLSAGFTEDDAGQAVLKGAEDACGVRPNFSDKVEDLFQDASQIRELMAAIQDIILNDYNRKVDLASGPDDEMDEYGALTFRALASRVYRKVNGLGGQNEE